MKLKVLLCAAAVVLGTATAVYAEDTIYKPGSEPTMYGVDVSVFQGDIGWDTLYDNIDFAILRCGYGQDELGQDDKRWKRNADACTKLGIPFGVYLYSYADTVEKAQSEADHVLRLVKGYDLTFPIYYDIEDEIHKELEPELLGDIAEAFCDKIEAAGYEVGVYSYKYFWENNLTDPVFNTKSWYIWVAQIGVSAPTYKKPFSMWQYTFEGVVDGIEGNVDLDAWFGELRGADKSKVKEKMNSTPTPAAKPTATAKPTAKPTQTPSPTQTQTAAPAASSAPKTRTPAENFTMNNFGDSIEIMNNSNDEYRIRVIINSYDKGVLVNSKSHDLTFTGKKAQRFKMHKGSTHKVFIYTREDGLVQILKKK